MIQRDELIAAEEKSWQQVHAFCSTISDADWVRPGANGDWSPKDIVAHIACWAAEAARRLECIRAGQKAEAPHFQAFNDEAYLACKDLTVHETLGMLASAHHRLREELEQIAPVALSAKVMEMVRECADRHYAEHLAQLTLFLGEGA